LNVGQTDTLSLYAIPSGGFNASIFLTLESFTTSNVTILPTTLNPPYDNCNIIVSASNLNPGIHQLIIKGAQGTLTSYDTTYIKVLFDPNLKWYQFKQQNSGLLCNDIDAIAVDKNNNMLVSTYGTCGNPSLGIVLYDHYNWQQWNYNSFMLRDFYGNLITQESNSMLLSCNGDVRDIAVDSNNVKWIGTSNGLIRQDGMSYDILFPGENIWCVTAHNNRVCFGTGGNGLKYFDGNTWVSFNTSNSYLPSNNIRKLAMENDSNLWIGTENGLAHYDFQYWTIYNSSNSILPNNIISALDVDELNNKWIATLGSGLIKYNNSSWQQFTPPCSEISTICADHSGNILLGFQSGETNNALVKFDGSDWTIYNSSNSGFNSDATTVGYGRIRSIKEDNNNTLWISTFGDGLFAFNNEGLNNTLPDFLITSIPIKEKASSSFSIYPNPNNGKFIIESNSEIFSDYNIILCNIQGEIIYKGLFNFNHNNSKSFSFDNLQKGMYFLNISSNNTSQTLKLVINK
jgi:Two component regulator propeller.